MSPGAADGIAGGPSAAIVPFGDVAPQIANDVFVAPGAAVAGDVEIAAGASVWFNAVVRGDVAPVRIGERTNIQDGAVLHVDTGAPCLLGREVTVGHGAIVHGAEVGDGALIGMGAIVLSRAKIGAGAIVAAGTLVTEGSIVPAGMLVMGVPARPIRQVSDSERDRAATGVRHYVELAAAYRHRPIAAGEQFGKEQARGD